ncbi:MAG: DUF58 domain-containing protein [Bifidobacterium aquikefiri]|uniref:DUF58 domain-containing protein n=1 Tax=Bifidobacterium aquikefiri TaxID=1653207 RepID=A0A261G209_9BIFI|nr:DUF58 domain-containing protein [Bifidobacterium aquikefiri]OZG65474.1 hypothetical protein BAQU_1657 [Bifidobacterium aquikefiri]
MSSLKHTTRSNASGDPIRRKIESLGSTLSLPTVRRAMGALEGEHASRQRGGSQDTLDIRAYEPGDEARLIDWKTSARIGRPMIAEKERPSTSRVWMLLDMGMEMSGSCEGGERALDVACNALAMFATLSLRRSDDISLVLGDSANITRIQFNGGFAQFERRLDAATERELDRPRNLDALLDYGRRIQDRNALVVLATDDTALEKPQLEKIRQLAQSHPVVVINVVTVNPFSRPRLYHRVVEARTGRFIPAFLAKQSNAEGVENHRRFNATQLLHELQKSGSRMLRSSSSELMFHDFVRLVSVSLARSSTNRIVKPYVRQAGKATVGDGAQ